ncbi:hypothetical protein [Aurantimonas sp. 22II-16-19i]|uniref:hypothetical protein n=1 Tax=Aurantimonas sp. 22II-16-19i TaxID=1317114 RepID=UPI0009F7C285|nr:hypothetical protein [Aurantimonas sp. 22II-16-19i]ORE89752.1 hypothetical protein ATO4_23777 [Aurantimonas sp. 22II-16-19i]
MSRLAGSTLGIEVPGPDDLHSGSVRTQPLTIVAGSYERGEVLEMTAATNKLGKLATAANAFAVMPYDVTLAAEQDLAVYVEGDFNEDAVKLNGVTLAPVKTALRSRSILLRKWGAAPASA